MNPDSIKMVGSSDKERNLLLANGAPIQTFANGDGCRAAVIGYCTEITGEFGAQNLADALIADGRFGSVTVIDGDVVLPTAQFLLDHFDTVIAVTDSGCGENNSDIANSAAEALEGYALGGGGLVLSTFGFSTCIGFGDAIFAPGLSPFQRVQCFNANNGGQIDFNSVGQGPVCQCIFNGITGPITVFPVFSNFVTLSQGAELCANYIKGLGFAAVNPVGNIIALNTFPFYNVDLEQEEYRRLIANALLCVCRRASRGVDFTKML